MATAQTLCARAYNQFQYESTSFGSGQPYPQSIAIELFNTVIKELNRWGPYDFTETDTTLTYVPGGYTYNLATLSVEPERITMIQRTLSGSQGFLRSMNEYDFQRNFRFTTIQTKKPEYFKIYSNTLELNSIPDQDYSIVVKHFKNLPEATVLTTDYSSTSPAIPSWFEDIATEGIMAYLAQRLGRADFEVLYALYEKKAKAMSANLQKRHYIPTQMPAAF